MNQQEELRALHQPQQKPKAKWLELPKSCFKRFQKVAKGWEIEALIEFTVVSGNHSGNSPIRLKAGSQARYSKGEELFTVSKNALIYALKKQCIGECELQILLADGGYYPITIYG